MAWKCVLDGKKLADERADRRSAVILEKYKLSKEAVYFEGQYLPFSAVTAVRSQPSLYYPQCCCGRGIPVFKVRLDYGAEKPLVLMLEKEKNVGKLLAAVREANPSVQVEERAESAPEAGNN